MPLAIKNWTWERPKRKEERKPATFTCPYCNGDVAAATNETMIIDDITGMPRYHIYKCPRCHMPVTLAPDGSTIPPSLFLPFDEIRHLPHKIKRMYGECRQSFLNESYFSVMTVSHSLLIITAIDKGATANKKFSVYVNYLKAKGFIAEQQKVWVEKIEELATRYIHETDEATKADAEKTIVFISQILKNIYELPAMAQEG